MPPVWVWRLRQSANDRGSFSVPNGASGGDGALARATALWPGAHPLPTDSSCRPMLMEVQHLKAIALAPCRLQSPSRHSQALPDGLDHFVFFRRHSSVRQCGTIRWAMTLLSLVSSVALGGESARLTIGGYVPPMQRVSAIRPQTSIAGGSAIILQEQSNSALGYTLTVETKTPSGQRDTSPVFRITSDSQQIDLTSRSARISRPPNQRPGQRSVRILEIARSPASANTTLVLTIASE